MMETMLRRFGIKKVEPRETESRVKLQKELFQYQKCADYGFPNKASSIAHNVDLNLLAIGTKNGCLKIYGAHGVQFSAEHEFDAAVQEIFFFGTKGTILTYCADNTFHLWEVENESDFRQVKSLCGEEKFQRPSSFCLSKDHRFVYIGSENGHVYTLLIENFKFSQHVVYQENVLQNAPQDFRLSLGSVECIQGHPTDNDKILIGYNRGLVALYDLSGKTSSHYYNSNQQLEYLAFHRDGRRFISCHANGSYNIWSTTASNRPIETTTPYGPFPCKAITKCLWKTTKVKDEPMMVFSGGMPKASYGDRHVVTAMCDKHHVTFDLTSKFIDFLVLCKGGRRNSDDDDDNEEVSEILDDPHTLLILAEEELIAIDLTTEGWPTLPVPYMATMHATAITCCTHVADVSATFYEELARAGNKQNKGKLSQRPWPITGGINYNEDHLNIQQHNLLITGHEDGSVRIWDVSTTDIILLIKFNISEFYESSSTPTSRNDEPTNNAGCLGDDDGDDDEEGEDWPPFRKVGSYDPYSDDPRLAIRKVDVGKEKKIIAIAGTAGQMVIMKFNNTPTTFDEFDIDYRPVRLNIIDERANFAWKGHDPMAVRKGRFKVEAGFQPVCIAQVFPPATCTALSLNSDWELAAVGTAHGFGVVDYKLKKFVEVKCTLNSADLAGAGEVGMSRRKSFKKSLRESFRRLRSRRSERHKKVTRNDDDGNNRTRPVNRMQSPSRQPNMTTTVINLDVPKPVERAVEARSVNDVEGSIVRALYFADTFLLTGHSHTPTFWAGTNLGTVFIYQLCVPDPDKRHEEEVQSVLAKEVHLRHRAPVMNICVVDKNGLPLTNHSDMTPGHSVVICSEEQIKIFSLPNLSAKEKFKLTAHEGTKVRRTTFATFANKSDPRYNETCLVCLTNLGEVQIFAVPSLRRQLKADCIRRDNIMGIVCCIFTMHGECFYMNSPSEFSRFSVSAKVAIRPNCRIRSLEVSNNRTARCILGSETASHLNQSTHLSGNSNTTTALLSISSNAARLSSSDAKH